jgi:hypothetical protein
VLAEIKRKRTEGKEEKRAEGETPRLCGTTSCLTRLGSSSKDSVSQKTHYKKIVSLPESYKKAK